VDDANATMTVLDIDLDFFLQQRVTGPRRRRPSCKDIAPWAASAVEKFLVQQCGLDSRKPLPGSIVKEHHELFDIWQHLIETGQLTVPFDLVHIDAHADVGMGGLGEVVPPLVPLKPTDSELADEESGFDDIMRIAATQAFGALYALQEAKE
jgi:hypothetical protein